VAAVLTPQVFCLKDDCFKPTVCNMITEQISTNVMYIATEFTDRQSVDLVLYLSASPQENYTQFYVEVRVVWIIYNSLFPAES